MDLSGLPQFTVDEVVPAPSPAAETLVVGRLSHVRGVRDERGWLYRSGGPSVVGDLTRVPAEPGERLEFYTPDADFAPELRPGAVYPWVPGPWDPRHLDLVLAGPGRWTRRAFAAVPARHFRLPDGVTGWQPLGFPLPPGAVETGVEEGGWDHEHCEICFGRIGAGGASDGYVDPGGAWLCPACYARYAVPGDISFALET